MSKFHINSKGVPAPCKATKGNCPYGGASGNENHYDSVEEAQEAANKQNEQQHGILPNVQPANPPTDKELSSMYLSEVEVKLKNGNVFNGISSTSNAKDGKITLRLNGGGYNTKEINLEDVQDMKALSEYTYYSKEYREDLRQNNKARPEFRFSQEGLEKHKGKFMNVNYDGKKFNGEVVDTFYDGEHNSGLIIQSESGETKHIKAYRLEDIEHTGNNLREHKQHQQLKELENFIDDNLLSNYDSEPGRSETADFENPSDVINNYFKAIIDKEKGLNVDLKKAGNHDFSGDLDRDSGAYDDSSKYYYDFEKGGGQYAEWTERSEEWYEEDLKAAEENEIFVEDRKELIDDMVKKVKETDWTPYYDTQEEGVIEALEHLYDIGIATDY